VSVPFKASKMEISRSSLSGYVALTGVPLNIEDRTPSPKAKSTGSTALRHRPRGLPTKSLLILPMRNHKDETIGVPPSSSTASALRPGRLGREECQRRRSSPRPALPELASSLSEPGGGGDRERAPLRSRSRPLRGGFHRASSPRSKRPRPDDLATQRVPSSPSASPVWSIRRRGDRTRRSSSQDADKEIK